MPRRADSKPRRQDAEARFSETLVSVFSFMRDILITKDLHIVVHEMQ